MTAVPRPGRRRSVRDDTGSASAFVLGMTLVLLAVAGLVADGGRAVNARVAIMDDAEQAARTGANQLDAASLRDLGVARVDPGAASTTAVEFLAARGYDPSRVTVTADGSTVSVTVRDDVPTTLLQIVLIPSFAIEGTATARAALGITTEIAGAP